MADLPNHRRPLSKCMAESTDTLNKTSHNNTKTGLFNVGALMLLAEINNLWFIHQNLGHVDRRICWADVQKCLWDVYAFLLVPCAHSILNKEKLSTDLSKTKTQEQNRLDGLENICASKSRNITDSSATLWMKTNCQTNSRNQPSRSRLPRVRITRFLCQNRRRHDSATGHAERWNILQTTPNNSPSPSRRTFDEHFLRKVLSIDLANPSETTQHRLGKCSETHMNTKRYREDNTSMQHRAPRRRLGNTFCERCRWLSKPSVSTFAKKRNAWTEDPSSAQQTFHKQKQKKAPISTCRIHIIIMATLWIEQWTLKGNSWTDLVTTRHTLGNRVTMDTWIWTATSANSGAAICQTATIYASSI